MKEKLEKLKGLCDLFRSNIKEYKSGKYDEANTRVDFIDKFFECLDWDVRNNQGLTESNREVVREDKVFIDKKPKAPDYSFRIGGYRKFFLEAKKPSVNVKEEIEPAFQIRRYGYTAKLSLSILTDFEEFAVYDTRIKPNKNDKANIARIFYCTFEDYEKQFDFLYNTFSKGAILNGSFDKYALENKIKKGSSEVDKEFLSLIEDWRESLAKNIAIRNKDLDIYSLNSAVQVIIDRIIFLRIAEDRKMEVYGMLLDACNQGVNNRSNIPTYQYLNQIFVDANKKYNSGLFYPKNWISDLSIDDKIFQTIIRNLYYPECPYELSVLPIEILGNIYEQFLGKTIRLTSGHQAKVEEKEEVRKAGGVYYTPQYIVNYIVQNTVGEKIKGVELYNHPKLTILDPACGSGSFLVGAYSFLLEKYLESYTDKKRLDKSLKNGLIYQVSRNTYRLSITVKQNILLHHIYGVDIDNQAVEVTKLSLLLKLMEDENTESADRLFKHSDLKLLPDLDNNIKCGNSLINSDFYEDKNLSLFGKEEMRKVNTFDWEKEFKDIFKDGGFDCVIGNPPYGAYFSKDEANYFSEKYIVFKGAKDAYACFIEASIQFLKISGAFSFIVPSAWLGGPDYLQLREVILQNKINSIILLPYNVFTQAYIDTTVFIISKALPQKNHSVKTFKFGNREKLKIIDMNTKDYSIVIQSEWKLNPDKKFILNNKALQLLKQIKIRSIEKFNDYIFIKRGVLFDKDLLLQKKVSNSYLYFEGDVYRYTMNNITNHWIVFDNRLKERPKELIWFQGNRILLRRLVNRRQRLMASITDKTFITNKNLYSLLLKENNSIDLKSILGLLNSKLISYIYINQITQASKDDFPQVTIKDILELPFPKGIQSKFSKLSSFVEQMLSVQNELHSAISDSDKKILQQKCDLLDKQIDKIVYELYGLTEAEIKIVEGN